MSGRVLRLDPIACDGHGLCAELFPERISLDDWGYPIVDPTPIGGDLVVHAQRAVSNCPVLALRLATPISYIDTDLRSDARGVKAKSPGQKGAAGVVRLLGQSAGNVGPLS